MEVIWKNPNPNLSAMTAMAENVKANQAMLASAQAQLDEATMILCDPNIPQDQKDQAIRMLLAAYTNTATAMGA